MGVTDRGELPFRLTAFQRDAVHRCLEILHRRRGVLLSDSVGLGKTYTTLGLITHWLDADGRVAVVTPAALRSVWHTPLRSLRSELRSPSSLVWLSHGMLSHGGYTHDESQRFDLVVVDEAHAFRNPGTRRHRALATLCRGAHVVLVTATPVNNSLADLYWLLRLFAGDGAFVDIGVGDLSVLKVRPGPRAKSLTRFDGADADSDSIQPARTASRVLAEIMVRRTRPFIRSHYPDELAFAHWSDQPKADRRRWTRRPDLDLFDSTGNEGGTGDGPPTADEDRPDPLRLQSPRFPQRAPPRAIRYSLDVLRPGLTTTLVDVVDTLTLAALRPTAYDEAETQSDTISALVRLGILKRLESSLAAFRISVHRQARFVEAFLAALERGRLLASHDHRTLYTGSETGRPHDDGDTVQLVLEDVTLRPLPPTLDCSRIRRDALHDLEGLRQILEELRSIPHDSDPKLRRLMSLLNDELSGQKAVVFTEFRDTARFLWRKLHRHARVGLIDGTGAYLGAMPAGRAEVIERFAPRANYARPPGPRERIDLLIATDVLSEGMNLQDAANVIGYDLPWNPVRMIQRIGRVDRLGSEHERVRSYHFLPEEGLERLLGVVRRLERKLSDIEASVGVEGRVLGQKDDPIDEGCGVMPGEEAAVSRGLAGEDATTPIDRITGEATEVMERLWLVWTRTRRRRSKEEETKTDASWHPTSSRRRLVPVAAIVLPNTRNARERALSPMSDPGQGRDHSPTSPLHGSPPDPPRTLHAEQTMVACSIAGRPFWAVGETDTASVQEDETAAARILLHALESGESTGDDHDTECGRHRPDAARSARRRLEIDAEAIGRTLSALEPLVAARRRAIRQRGPVRKTTTSGLAAERVRHALATVPGGPGPELCGRADALLHTLGGELDSGTEEAVRSVIEGAGDQRPPKEAEALIAMLERALTPMRRSHADEGREGEDIVADEDVVVHGIIQVMTVA